MPIALSHDHVGISVLPDDLDATIAWYAEALDFVVERRFEVHGRAFAFIANGDVRIELVGGATEGPVPASDDIATSHTSERLHHVCLRVPDLDEAVGRLRERGVSLIGGPVDVPTIGQRIAFVTDNLGNIVELTAHRSPSAEG
jgi:catechol 2,3-dioxygenase-like lactoylglutathione lyase family enzyme